MYKSATDINKILGDFKLKDRMFRYSRFVPKLYNYCKSLGFETGKIMPSRAFCSDESQGYPVILICKHFGAFPFNHGRVGGIVSTDRHGPHADHGKDMVIIQASHVGYEPDSNQFGVYRRVCTEHGDMSSSCGKVDAVLSWYLTEFEFARNNIFIEKRDNDYLIHIDNLLLNIQRDEGVFLHLDKLIESEGGEYLAVESHSTSKYFKASETIKLLFNDLDNRSPIGDKLLPEFFFIKKKLFVMMRVLVDWKRTCLRSCHGLSLLSFLCLMLQKLIPRLSLTGHSALSSRKKAIRVKDCSYFRIEY